MEFIWDEKKNSELLNLLVVCHCYREEAEVIRIISARKATKMEIKSYGGK